MGTLTGLVMLLAEGAAIDKMPMRLGGDGDDRVAVHVVYVERKVPAVS